MPAFQKHTKTIQRAPVPMADVCAELALPPDADVRDLCRALLVRAFDFPADTVVDLGATEVVFTWEGEAKKESAKPSKKKEDKPVETPKPIETDWKGMLNEPAGNAAEATEDEKAALVKEIVALELVTPSWLELRGDIGLAGSAIAAGIVKHDYRKAAQYAEKLRAVPKAAVAK